MRQFIVLSLALASAAVPGFRAEAQTPKQPKVAPGPDEPDWVAILKHHYGLSMFGDLLNPVRTTPEATPGLFQKVGAGPVTFTPVIALGLPTVNRGGWYRPPAAGDQPEKHELWSYQFRNSRQDLQTGANLPPPLAPGSITTFEPGDRPFGLWVANDGLKDGGVFSQPRLVAAINQRLAKQPYKAMIYPNRDKATGKLIPHSYLIGWEYSTNDDFQDVVCRLDNAELLQAEPAPGGTHRR
jgi:hypothetical protein